MLFSEYYKKIRMKRNFRVRFLIMILLLVICSGSGLIIDENNISSKLNQSVISISGNIKKGNYIFEYGKYRSEINIDHSIPETEISYFIPRGIKWLSGFIRENISNS